MEHKVSVLQEGGQSLKMGISRGVSSLKKGKTLSFYPVFWGEIGIWSHGFTR
ncbi:hypothetical protein [Sunxiuqinia elliptica]|uniref:hypothetical protein n=1 Tax=Sunxiuqinia elliptica TaxID=655355 RepID=UPI0014152EFE|nr:hypothetical protein [Sunxiuqinia elliptica]